jgi:hypothetical protein
MGRAQYADLRHAQMADSVEGYRNWLRAAVFQNGLWLVPYGVKYPDFIVGVFSAIAAIWLSGAVRQLGMRELQGAQCRQNDALFVIRQLRQGFRQWLW